MDTIPAETPTAMTMIPMAILAAPVFLIALYTFSITVLHHIQNSKMSELILHHTARNKHRLLP